MIGGYIIRIETQYVFVAVYIIVSFPAINVTISIDDPKPLLVRWAQFLTHLFDPLCIVHDLFNVETSCIIMLSNIRKGLTCIKTKGLSNSVTITLP